MKKPVIGITTRIYQDQNRNFDQTPNDIIKKVEECGGIALIIPELKNLDSLIKLFDGFIIPGGNYWHKTDEYIIKYAIDNDIPLLGICAGMQAIANKCFFDADVSDHTYKIQSAINHNSSNEYVHPIKIVGSNLKKIIPKEEIYVNSRHSYTILKQDYFKIEAVSEDGIIEAISIPKKKFILGVQWHPENLDDEYSLKIFKYFISKC